LLVNIIFFLLYFFIFFRDNAVLHYVEFFGTLTGTFIIGNCGSLLKGFISWVNESYRKNELEKQTLKVELELLRSQLNHHFLFNTLNNIDTLIFKNPQKASDALISLSSILRYMLYDANTERVTMGNELKNIENIIYLEQLRVSTPNYTEVNVEGDALNKMVPPLLFVSFVENAYKHSKFIGKLPVIEIKVYTQNDKLVFTCINTMEEVPKTSAQPGNIGLENIRRRLNLLYGNSCKFEITKENSLFMVYLEIPCN
jgi:LytS/YehU family sensor histidine kinase